VTGTMAGNRLGVGRKSWPLPRSTKWVGVLGRQINFIQEDGGSDWPTFAPKKGSNRWSMTRSYR
jgi:urea transport system substrate-binding protein